MQRILLLEDNVAYAVLLKQRLSDEGFDVTALTNSQAALASLEVQKYAVIVTDLSLPDLGGTNLLERLRSAAEGTPIIVMSGFYFPTMLQELIEAGATDALGKPFRFVELLLKIKTALNPT